MSLFLTKHKLTGAEGSAGPEGGREAPALGGGSGAGRRVRRAGGRI